MTRHAPRGGLRRIHAARAVEARESIENLAGFYRHDPAPRPVRARNMRLVNALHRLVAPLGFILTVAALVLGAWLFYVAVTA